ncbi:MAG: hypothetical protein U0174_15870 [Polyangiaceae bacterium]
MNAPIALLSLAPFVGVFEGTLTYGSDSHAAVIQIESDGGKLKAQYCKRGGRNCRALDDIVVDRNHILATLTYENPAQAPSNGTAMYRTLVSLDLSADGRTLTGIAFSTKCNCAPSLSLTRRTSP